MPSWQLHQSEALWGPDVGELSASCAAWPHVQYGRLRNMATCAIWPSVQYGLRCNMASCAIWPSVQHGLLCDMAFGAIWPPVRNGRLCSLAACALWPPVQYCRLCNMATRATTYTCCNIYCAVITDMMREAGPPAIWPPVQHGDLCNVISCQSEALWGPDMGELSALTHARTHTCTQKRWCVRACTGAQVSSYSP